MPTPHHGYTFDGLTALVQDTHDGAIGIDEFRTELSHWVVGTGAVELDTLIRAVRLFEVWERS